MYFGDGVLYEAPLTKYSNTSEIHPRQSSKEIWAAYSSLQTAGPSVIFSATVIAAPLGDLLPSRSRRLTMNSTLNARIFLFLLAVTIHESRRALQAPTD